jgi:hypothetical protein
VLHGWPGLRARDLIELASTVTRNGKADGFDFSCSGYETGVAVRHPYDEGVALHEKDLSASTIRLVYTVARAALEGAVRDGMLARNPAVKRPGIKRREVRHLDAPDVAALLKAAHGHRHHAVLVTLWGCAWTMWTSMSACSTCGPPLTGSTAIWCSQSRSRPAPIAPSRGDPSVLAVGAQQILIKQLGAAASHLRFAG